MEADVVTTTEGSIEVLLVAKHRDSTGVQERGMQTSGTPRNLGDPVVSASANRKGNRTIKPKTQEGGFPSPGSE